MFDNNNNLYSYSFNVQLDEVVKMICDIAFDIGKQIEEWIEVEEPEKGFSISDLFQDHFLIKIGIRKESLSSQVNKDGTVTLGYTNEEFFAHIANYYNNTLFYSEKFLSGIKGSDILFINKRESNYLSYGETAKERLIHALKTAKILKDIILNLKSTKIEKSLEKIDVFENNFFYKNTISIKKQEGQPLFLCIDMSFIKTESIKAEKVDSEDYWINFDKYKNLGFELTKIEDYSLCIDPLSKKEIGLIISEKMLPFPNVDLTQYILESKLKNYFFDLISKTYNRKPTKGVIIKTEPILDEFKALKNNEQLNQLLSYLKNNYFIVDPATIHANFTKFFNPVVLLDELECLNDYQFLMSSSTENETALGVYSKVKNEKSYNLMHWVNHKGADKVNHFRAVSPTEKSKQIIQTLKPSISYYFLEKYFEDVFESILRKNNFQFFSNGNFYKNGNSVCEIDFFIITPVKFYYIETKTKLSKFYIDDFLVQASKMIEKFKPILDQNIEIEFVICSGYSDENVSYYQYFIDESIAKKDAGYNSTRVNLACKPYYFTVPIPDREGRTITCIAEPEYNKLEYLVLELCQR